MRKWMALLLLCALALAAGPAWAEENLLVNGSFEELDAAGWPVGWTDDMWRHDMGVSYLEVLGGGMDGGNCAMIENVATNDARFVQTVRVEPDSVYRLSGWVKAEGIAESAAGASLSIIGSFERFTQAYDTVGEWVYHEAYVRTASTQRELLIGARLGDYSADNTGTAYFDDLSFTRVESPPANVAIVTLVDHSLAQQPAQEETPAPTEEAEAQLGMLPMTVAFLAMLLLLWVLRLRGVPYPRAMIWLVLALAALLRLYLMATQPGYPTDMSCFYAWSTRMDAVGPNAFYAPDYFCDYPPGYMYPLWLTGALLRLFGITGMDAAGRVIVKLVPFLADLGAIWLLWHLARKALGDKGALLLAALYAVSPAILVDGAMWGQVDAVLALGLLATVALVLKGNWAAALPVFTVTVLMKPQALMAGPIGLVALVADVARWKDGGRRALARAGIGLGISAAVAAAMLLPFLWGKAQPIAWVLEQYTTTLDSYQYATLNTANLYYLIGANWVPLGDSVGGLPITYGTLSTVLMALSIVGMMGLYIWRRDRKALPFFGAMLYIALYLLAPKMHERYLFPAFILLLYAFVQRRDWRLLAMFAGFSVTFSLNCAWVLRDIHLPLGMNLWGCLLSVLNLGLFGLGLWAAIDRRTLALPDLKPEGDEEMTVAYAGEDGEEVAIPVRASQAARLASIDRQTRPLPRMRRKDWIAMLTLTAVYALIAFIGLGSTVAPQTTWMSSGALEQVIIDLGAQQTFRIMYYPAINQRDHEVTFEFSDDGVVWYDSVPQKVNMGDCFRWVVAVTPYYSEDGSVISWTENPVTATARYVRMKTEGPSVSLMEIAFQDMDGNTIAAHGATHSGARAQSASDPLHLIDEADTVPAYPSYYNGTYFDEIYHARTGYEHAHQLSTYEWTHPPLGKVFIMLAIKLFGMTPFGWRFAGALAGVLMVPAMYLLGKLLFRRTRYALLAAFVMAFDLMHLTQTRIATIDSFAVLFIILMYLCMLRYMQMSFYRDGWRTLIPLGLSGLFMGLGCASKWIGMYAAVGLAVLFAWTMIQRALEWYTTRRVGGPWKARTERFPVYLIGTGAACLLFFIAIPFAIYYFSYIPQYAAEGGLTWNRFWSTQDAIWGYHSRLVDDHAFQSPWYEWPLMLKPMYYFRGAPHIPQGMVSTIMCMGNPAVWWVGFAAFLYVAWRWLKPHLLGKQVADHRPAMILLAFAAQYLPWVLVPRSMFIYHYFGSLPFVMLCIVYALEQIALRRPRLAWRMQIGYMAVVAVLFVAFYPIGTGVLVPEAWARAVDWLSFLKLPSWNYGRWIYY